MIQGEKKLIALIEGLRRRAKKDLCSLISPEILVRANLQGQHNNLMSGRICAKYRVITQKATIPNFDVVVARLLDSGHVEIRYTKEEFKEFKMFPRFGFNEDEVVLITADDLSSLSSLWTNNEIIVGLMKEYFEKLWHDALEPELYS